MDIEHLVTDVIGKEAYVILEPLTYGQIMTYKPTLEDVGGIYLTPSKYLGSFATTTIAAKTKLGSEPILELFKCFTPTVWTFILVSLLILSLISSFKSNFQTVMTYFWNYSILLLSQAMDSTEMKGYSLIITSFWFISALLITIQFTVFFIDAMVVPVPIIRINTLEDLAQAKSMNIIIRPESSLYNFANKENSSLALTLRAKIEEYTDFYGENISQRLIKGFADGTAAFLNDRLILAFAFIEMSMNYNISFESIHISTESASYEPYFLYFNTEFPQWASTLLNNMYVSY